MMSEIEAITETLPKIDCGSCGAPTCMAFAEDIVKGETTADECTVILKMLFHDQLEKYKDKSIFDKLTPISKPETGDGGEDR
ncbi:MAG: hypothetical protein J6L96_00270 [Clostridia bacterium]|nr:hypothetical protein [Clostridia bacterium]